MITAIDAHYYLAKDLKRALTFYCEVLKLKVATEYPSGTEFILPDDTAFGIFTMPNGEWMQCGGVMFAVSDIAQSAEEVEAGGGTLLTGLNESPVCHVMWCTDTEGNSFALHTRKA